MKKFNICSLAYVLLKPPFLTEKEAIDEAINSIKKATAIGFERISLEPMSVHRFTVVDALSLANNYRVPWFWSVIEVVEKCKDINDIGIGGVGYFPPSDLQAHNHCKNDICCNTLVLPFWSKTRELFSDDIRDLIIFSTPFISNYIELDNGDVLSIEEFSKKPQSQRRYYLKYAGSDVTKNWGSRGVYRLSNESSIGCEAILKKCLKASERGEIWMLQKEISNKKEIEYFDKDGAIKTEIRNVKYSSFYGPTGLIGVLGYYRNHFKVHGQNDTVLSYIVTD